MPNRERRPSVVLQGFIGGVVNTADAASRLAQVILGRLVGQRRLERCLPLQVQDRGDRWSLSGSGGDPPSECRIEINKLDAAVLSLGVPTPPEILSDAATAQKFAAILAETAGDGAGSEQHARCAVTDRGNTWLVRCGGHITPAIEGPGPFLMEVQKRDARVLDLWFEWVLDTPPDVDDLLRAPRK